MIVLDIEFSYLWDKKYAWRVRYIDRKVLKEGFKDFELQVYVDKYTFLGSNMLSLSTKVEDDDKINVCNEYEKLLIESKVKLLNKKYSSDKVERCEKGEVYWYIETGFGEYPFNVQYSREEYSDRDNKLFNKGNYFNTEDEAQEKLDKLINCFYKED